MTRSLAAIGAAVAIGFSSASFGAVTEATPTRTAQEEHQAAALVEELLALRPPENVLYGIMVRVESSEGGRSEVPIRYLTTPVDDKGWEATYEARASSNRLERLSIIHRQGEPNQYRYTPDVDSKPALLLSGAQADLPFAASDYWLSDLGMEFLHWPQQRTVKHKITMRNNRPCHVLESINPKPNQGGYRRVLSWIDRESGALIYAEAYDQNHKRFKIFTLHGFRKVNGQWQPKALQIQNSQTDSRSQLEFRFETQQ
jgi:hypothetical protein